MEVFYSGSLHFRAAINLKAHFPNHKIWARAADEVRHGGGLGNLKADANGMARSSVRAGGVTIDGGIAFGNGTDSIVGRGLVVHANADDLKSEPARNSGARLACGVITRNPDRKTAEG